MANAAQNCRPWGLDGILSTLRYFVTVLRATVIPFWLSSSTILSSESGFCLSSLAMTSRSCCLIVSQATSSPSLVVVPPPKNRFKRRLHAGFQPIFVNPPAHGRNVNAHEIGDLLHLERLDSFGPLVQEVAALVADDCLGNLQQGIPPLLDGLNKPPC